MRYYENFDDGPGGWHGWISNQAGPAALNISNGVVRFDSPWWVDYNHALPGAGYLHLTMGLRLRENEGLRHGDLVNAVAGVNRYTKQKMPNDLREATITIRLRGQIAMRGARLQLLVQSQVAGKWINHVLTAKPFVITREWSTQSVVLHADPEQWLCLGSRADRTETYGCGSIHEVLADTNGNLILVLFPLNIVPEDPEVHDPHGLRAGQDYAVQSELLPEGFIEYDSVTIDFAPDAVAGLQASQTSLPVSKV